MQNDAELEERSQELIRERAARARAEEQAERWAFLAEAGPLLTSSLDYHATLGTLARLAVPRLGDWCAVDVHDTSGQLVRIVTAHPDPAKERLAVEMAERYPADPDADFGVPNVLRTGEPELVPTIPEELLVGAAVDEEHLRIIRELGLRSYMVVPLNARGRTLGAITLVAAESERVYGDDDLRFAMELASRAALAVDNARLFRESEEARAQLEEQAAELEMQTEELQTQALQMEEVQAELETSVEELSDHHEALRESEQRFRFLTDAIPVQVWTARPDGALDFVSPQTAAYFGTTPAVILENGWLDVVDPEQVPQVVERWTRSLATGEPYDVEFRLRDVHGRYRWHLARAVPQRDAEGRILRWFGSNTEIQASKEAEQERERLIREVQLERARLREIFQEAPAFIATVTGPEHRFEMANPLYDQLVGHREVVGRTVAEALPEVVEQGFVELLDRVYESGEPYLGTEVPIQVQRRPGGALEERFLNFVYQPMRGLDGASVGIFVHGVDVTDQVRARQAAEQKSRELDQFAYAASHDLKAPLRGIANLSTWIEEDLQGAVTPQVREHMDLLRGRVHRMEGLIDGILQYSRAGRARARPEPVDVSALLDETIDLIAPPDGVEIRIAEAMPTLVAERLPLQQVFMNLIGNAVKYNTAADPRVEVSATPDGDGYRFTVKDNGPGIAPEYHERIFGLFQTLAARDHVEGTGIGLSLVKKIVESRAGRVWVESEEGAGATFHFTWPRTPPPEEAP